MAKPAWLTIVPMSGNSNETVNCTGTEHTGRIARSYAMKISATGPAPCTVTATQTPLAEFVTFTSNTSSIGKEGGNLTITGRSNSTKLTFSLGASPSLPITLPENYTANGVSTANGAAITGDPGAVAAYDFSIVFSVPENTTISNRTATLNVADNGGTSAGAGQFHSTVITQNAGDAYLYINEEGTTSASITIGQKGGSDNGASFHVLSNADWTIA
nr:MAG TPA: hypothetical protein [Herelleviridae sp.]